MTMGTYIFCHNWYVYGNQNPVMWVDEDGLSNIYILFYAINVTDAEYQMYLQNKKHFEKTMWLGREAEIEANKRYEIGKRKSGDKGIDDNEDAYRHILWAALITKELGEEYARERLYAHEIENGLDSQMDNLNNEVGIKLATENASISNFDLKRLAQQMVDSGQAYILDKNKTRIVVSDDKYRKKKYKNK